MVEQLAVNQWVAGSSPAAGAIIVMLLLYKDLKSIFKGSYSKKKLGNIIFFSPKRAKNLVYTDLAQPGEHLSYKQKVTGSNPVVGTYSK